MLHFPAMGCKRACVAVTDPSAPSSSSAALRIFSRMALALISWERVRRYSSMRTDSGASGDPSTSRISGIGRLDLLFNHRTIPTPYLAPPAVPPLPLAFLKAPVPIAVLHHRATLETLVLYRPTESAMIGTDMQQMAAKPEVFISYATGSKPFAQILSRELEKK